MIRKLVESDRGVALDFLSKEPSINLFIIGDIEIYGFHNDFQEVYGQFDDEKLEGVLLRFHENFIPYWKKKDFNSEGFKQIIRNAEGKIMISGKESIVKNFCNIFTESSVRTTYFCELKDDNQLNVSRENILKAKDSDSEKIFNFIDSIEEFTGLGNSKERIESVLRTQAGRIYYMESEEGEVITVSQTTAENSKSAMIVGVATKKDYRKKGLMTKCLSTLCKDVLDEGKILCLFYDNPKAGNVYLKLGFKSIDNWIMIIKK